MIQLAFRPINHSILCLAKRKIFSKNLKFQKKIFQDYVLQNLIKDLAKKKGRVIVVHADPKELPLPEALTYMKLASFADLRNNLLSRKPGDRRSLAGVLGKDGYKGLVKPSKTGFELNQKELLAMADLATTKQDVKALEALDKYLFSKSPKVYVQPKAKGVLLWT